MTPEQLERYGRHIVLPDIGLHGQQQCMRGRALVVGLGGLGSPVALYLAGSGVGRLELIDDDVVDRGNLPRQILYANGDIGLAKAQCAAARLRASNPDVEIHARQSRLSGEALEQAVAAADVVVDCSDNFATRYALNRAALRHGKPLVSGAAIRMTGMITVLDFRNQDSPCYACLFPDEDDAGGGCAQQGVFAPLVGMVATMQAAEALKILMGLPAALIGRLLRIDVRDMCWRDGRARRDPDCPVCAKGGMI